MFVNKNFMNVAPISESKPPNLRNWTWKCSSCLLPRLPLVELCLYICYVVLTARPFSGRASGISSKIVRVVFDFSHFSASYGIMGITTVEYTIDMLYGLVLQFSNTCLLGQPKAALPLHGQCISSSMLALLGR